MFELTPDELIIASAHPKEVATLANYYLTNILHMTSDRAVAMAQQHVVYTIMRKTDPLYGHTQESLMDLYSELKALEDAESGADREADYEGTDEYYKTDEEIKAYVLKHNMNSL